jgi:hypothetical protein
MTVDGGYPQPTVAATVYTTGKPNGSAAPSFALTRNVPAHNNNRIDSQTERVTGDMRYPTRVRTSTRQLVDCAAAHLHF